MIMHSSFGTLARDTARPFYQQIKDSILQKIKSGDWAPGEKVPSEHTLVQELGVSRMTVHRALRELTQMGHLERVHGVGTFVAESTGHASLIELKDIADEIKARGKEHHAKVKQLEKIKVDQHIIDRMQLKHGNDVFHIVVLHLQDGVPIQLEDRFVNPQVAPAFLNVDFVTTTPTQYLMSLFRPDEIEHTVQAVMPNADTSDMLQISRTEPCLRLIRRTWKQQEVVTYVSLLYPSSRYDLVARYTTDRFENIPQEQS